MRADRGRCGPGDFTASGRDGLPRRPAPGDPAPGAAPAAAPPWRGSAGGAPRRRALRPDPDLHPARRPGRRFRPARRETPSWSARASRTPWCTSSTSCRTPRCSGSSTRSTGTGPPSTPREPAVHAALRGRARSLVLATNVIELRLKYAKVAPLPNPQRPAAAAAGRRRLAAAAGRRATSPPRPAGGPVGRGGSPGPGPAADPSPLRRRSLEPVPRPGPPSPGCLSIGRHLRRAR